MSECDSSDHPVSVVVILLSNRCTDFDEIWPIYASKLGYSSLFKSRLYDLFPSNYANKLLGSYVTCIFTIYYYIFI